MSNHQGSVCISGCGRISPFPEHEAITGLHSVAFSDDPQNYEEFLQARNFVWDLEMNSSFSELLPATFTISSEVPLESEAELSRMSSALGLYFNRRVEDEVPNASTLSPIQGLDLLQADSSVGHPALDPIRFSVAVAGFFSAIFFPELGISPVESDYTYPAGNLEKSNDLTPSSLPTSSPIHAGLLDSFSPTDSLSTDRLLPEKGATKIVELFSYEEVNQEGINFIPALILRKDEIIGDRILDPKHGGYFYYDLNVPSLHHLIEERSFGELPERQLMASQYYLEDHAVRLFVETLSHADVSPTPVYKYIGDFYLQRTGKWLETGDWATCRAETKDGVMARFIESNDVGYHSQKVKSPSEISKLYDQGRMFPRILLHPTYGSEPLASSTSYEECLPSPLLDIQETKDSFAMLYATPHLSCQDSISVYSQESAPRSLLDSPPRISSFHASQNVRLEPLPSEELEGPYANRASTLVESMDSITMNEIEEGFHLFADPGSVEKLPSLSCALKGDHVSDYGVKITPQKSGRITHKISSIFKTIRARGILGKIPSRSSMNPAELTSSWKRRVMQSSSSSRDASDTCSLI